MIKAQGIMGRTEIAKVNPHEIIVDESENYRQDYGNIKELKESIQQNGLLTPVRLRKLTDNTLQLVSGYRRMRAIMESIDDSSDAFPWIPAVIETKNISDQEILLHNLATNEGLKPTPLEECEAYTRLKNWGMNQKDIAKRVGKSNTHVSNAMKLRNASPELQDELKNKTIGKVDAIKIVEKSNGSTTKQSEEIATTKAAKAKAKADKKAKKATQPSKTIQGMVTPSIPGMASPPVNKPKNTPKTSAGEGCDFTWLIPEVQKEMEEYMPGQDPVLVQAQIDDLIDVLMDIRKGLGGDDNE